LVTLTFSRTITAKNPLDLPLIFGADDVASDFTGQFRATLPLPTLRIVAKYDNAVLRTLNGYAGLSWAEAEEAADQVSIPWETSGVQYTQCSDEWQKGKPDYDETLIVWGGFERHRSRTTIAWDNAQQLRASTGERYKELMRTRERNAIPWDKAQPVSIFTGVKFVFLVPKRATCVLPWDVAQQLTKRWTENSDDAIWCPRQVVIPWELTQQPPRGTSPFEPPTPPSPHDPIYNPDLVFRCPMVFDGLRWLPSLPLVFGGECWRTDYNIPIQDVYFVSNDVNIVRLPDRTPIDAMSVNLRIDESSWTWDMSASIPITALPLVEPTENGVTEIEITINGVVWIMIVESYDKSQAFASNSVTIAGKSRAAYLATPYAPTRSFASVAPFTAQQLAEQELIRADLITGFSLNWQIPDWLVPAGAFSYESLAPVSVIQKIAESVGAYVNAHHYNKELLVKSKYPSLPWEWASATPDFEAPLDILETLSARWLEYPAYNGVYVSGTNAGVTALVKVYGSDGAEQAEMQTNALITHADAARELGRSILGNTGKQELVTMAMPMLLQTGLLTPGMLFETGEPSKRWRGLIRSTAVSATFSDSLIVRQTISVERHIAS